MSKPLDEVCEFFRRQVSDCRFNPDLLRDTAIWGHRSDCGDFDTLEHSTPAKLSGTIDVPNERIDDSLGVRRVAPQVVELKKQLARGAVCS
jgi:hypothetical protein